MASSPSTPDLTALAKARVGETLGGRYRLDRLLGVGGTAAVFAATHRNGSRVAIKMLHRFVAARDELRERFLREGYIANRVRHRGAIPVLDDEVTAGGDAYLVMDLLEGDSLDRVLHRARGTLSTVHVLSIADQVLDVLAAFHEASVVHRDIKPGNIFLGKDGVTRVLDFGLARLAGGAGTPSTAPGLILGTAGFMAPEQARGERELDARCDVFGVGAVMYYALSGALAHPGAKPKERVLAAMKKPVRPLASVRPDTPDWLSRVVDRACAFEREQRWPSASAMRREVRSALVLAKDEPPRGDRPALPDRSPQSQGTMKMAGRPKRELAPSADLESTQVDPSGGAVALDHPQRAATARTTKRRPT